MPERKDDKPASTGNSKATSKETKRTAAAKGEEEEKKKDLRYSQRR